MDRSSSESRTSGSPTFRTSRTSSSSGLEDLYKRDGNAIDVVVVRGKDGHLFSTPWDVCFNYSMWKSSSVGDQVSVFINEQRVPVPMILQPKGRCTFVGGSTTCPSEVLNVLELKDGENLIRFEHCTIVSGKSVVRFVDARLYVWYPDEHVVVTDLDGTITPSDVEGHIRTLRLGQHDFIHKGVCLFFTKLANLGCRIVYLTARPITWATMSREHLHSVQQEDYGLPLGPLITTSGGLRQALYMEAIRGNPHEFKAGILLGIAECFAMAGRSAESPVFIAGFGNRHTDVAAYSAVGINIETIFLIDEFSHIRVADRPTEHSLNSYSDPRLFLWLIPRIRPLFSDEEKPRLDALFEMQLSEEAAENEIRRQRAATYQAGGAAYLERASRLSGGGATPDRQSLRPSLSSPAAIRDSAIPSAEAARRTILREGAEIDELDYDLFGTSPKLESPPSYDAAPQVQSRRGSEAVGSDDDCDLFGLKSGGDSDGETGSTVETTVVEAQLLCDEENQNGSSSSFYGEIIETVVHDSVANIHGNSCGPSCSSSEASVSSSQCDRQKSETRPCADTDTSDTAESLFGFQLTRGSSGPSQYG